MPPRLLPFVAAACVAFPATAQVRVQAGIGLAASSALVEDFIVKPITVRPALAPTLWFALDGRLDPTYRIGVGLGVARSTLRQHTEGQTSDIVTCSRIFGTMACWVEQHTEQLTYDIVTLTVWQPTIRVSRTLNALEVGARGGLQIYQAAQPIGLFLYGGTITPTVGVDAGLPGLRLGSLRVGLTADWMISRFSTSTLRLFGFRGKQMAHRFGLRIAVAGGHRAP
ncbi:MAG: hypothetical protein WD934_08325 [Gemmatimonadales bacterium]